MHACETLTAPTLVQTGVLSVALAKLQQPYSTREAVLSPASPLEPYYRADCPKKNMSWLQELLSSLAAGLPSWMTT